MKVTIKDIAKQTGLTVATVSRALNDNPIVSEKTRAFVMAKAVEMGYIKNVIAQGLATTQHTNTVGVIVPDITNPYFPVLVKGIQDTLITRSYTTFLCNSNADLKTEEELIRMLCGLRVQGIIMDPVCTDSENIIRTMSSGIRTVFVSSIPSGNNLHYVSVDNFVGAVNAVRYLVGLGHRKIAYFGGNDGTNTYNSRLRGYCSIMEEHFGFVDSNMIRLIPPTRESGFAASTQMILSGNVPSAIFASNDVIALGVIECFIKHGFSIPEDISVIGFDDIEYASLPGINLTTVREPRYEIGVKAAQMMLQLFESEPAQSLQEIIYPELILRNTCAKAN